VLIVTHGGVISALHKLLIERNGYLIHENLDSFGDGIWEVRNCSITEIVLRERGPGQFIRMGDWEHIWKAAELDDTKDRLENSTGE